MAIGIRFPFLLGGSGRLSGRNSSERNDLVKFDPFYNGKRGPVAFYDCRAVIHKRDGRHEDFEQPPLCGGFVTGLALLCVRCMSRRVQVRVFFL